MGYFLNQYYVTSLLVFPLSLTGAVMAAPPSVPLGVPSVTTQGQSPETLLIAHVERARLFDPNFRAAQAAFDSALQATKATAALLGPRVSLSMSAFRNNRVEESRDIFGRIIDVDRDFNTQNANIQARQTIFRKRDSLSLEQSRAQEAAAERLAALSEQELYYRVSLAWIEILSLRGLEKTYLVAAQATEEASVEVTRRFAGGESTRQEVEQAKARLGQTRALIGELRSRLSIARQTLRHIVGPDADVPGGIAIKPFKTLPEVVNSEAELMDRIRNLNAEVAATRFQEDAARLERDKVSSDRLPTIDMIATASKGQNDTLNSVKDEYRIGLQLNLPLYTHGGIDATVAQADANYRKMQAQAVATLLKVHADALKDFGNIRVLGERIQAADELVHASRTLMKAQQASLLAGVSSRGEVSQSVVEQATAVRESINVRKEYLETWLRLHLSLGSLDRNSISHLASLVLARNN